MELTLPKLWNYKLLQDMTAPKFKWAASSMSRLEERRLTSKDPARWYRRWYKGDFIDLLARNIDLVLFQGTGNQRVGTYTATQTCKREP